MKKEALTQGVPVMSKDKLNSITSDLDIAIYRLNAFVETVRDVIDDMPIKKEDDSYPGLCYSYCLNAQNKLDVLTNQLMLELDECIKLVSDLEKEVF